LIAGSTFGNRPVAVKVGAVSDPCPAAVKVGLGSTPAEPRRHANGRNRRTLAVSPARRRRTGVHRSRRFAPTALTSVFRAEGGRWRDGDEAAGFGPNAPVWNST